MPVPIEYYQSSQHFKKFMVDARDVSGLATTNMAWNMVVGVFQTFRRRLSINDALRFANALPPGIRALFVADWNADEPLAPFSDTRSMMEEVKSVRSKHNFSPDSAIHDVAVALRRNVDSREFNRMLSTLPPEAMRFWDPGDECGVSLDSKGFSDEQVT